jgi:hypothetical protein
LSFCNQLAAADLTSLDGYVLVDALSTAIVVRYSRCFTTGVRDRLKDEIIAELPEDLRAIHAFVRLARDKYIAHSVNALEENNVTVHVREHPDPPALGGVGTLQARSLVLSPEDASQVGALCRAVISAVSDLMREQEDIVKKEIDSQPLEEIYDLPEPSAYVPNWREIHLSRKRQ